MSNFAHVSRFAVCIASTAACVAALGLVVPASAATTGGGEGASAGDVVAASALLAVDRHRPTIVERIVSEWGQQLANSGSGVGREQLREILFAMRADQLLAASLAGSLDGLKSIVVAAAATRRSAAEKMTKAADTPDALGDVSADLVYTPVTPCRLFDTRASQGGLGTPTVGVRRTYGAITPVASQGGTGGCVAPSGAAVALIQIGTLTPWGNGLLQGGPQGAASFPNALILYQAGDQYGTALAMPLNPANGQFDLVEQFATADLYGDLLGYFQAATGFHRQGGSAFGTTAVLGTTDNQPLEIRVHNSRVVRYQQHVSSPNIIGGHPDNIASAEYGGQTIGGGGASDSNCAPRSCRNETLAGMATIGGGWGNQAAFFGTVGGGSVNTSGNLGTVGGGSGNTAGSVGTAGGGESNNAIGSYSTIAGGRINTASGTFDATVGGGYLNLADGSQSTIAGGNFNNASGVASTIAGGYSGTAGGNFSTVTGGSGNTAGGAWSTVAGGYTNSASGTASFAAGFRAKTEFPGAIPIVHNGAFVWADYHDVDFNSVAANEFAVRATGGVRLVLGIDGGGTPTWTCSLANGGSWACSSDRNQKQNLRQLDGQAVLAQLATMAIYSWNPKGENAHLRHYGPTAQDFYAGFGLGDSDLRIGQQDADGVAFAAIQGLNEKLEAKLAQKDREIAELKRAVEILLDRTSSEGRVAERR